MKIGLLRNMDILPFDLDSHRISFALVASFPYH